MAIRYHDNTIISYYCPTLIAITLDSEKTQLLTKMHQNVALGFEIVRLQVMWLPW